MQCRLDIEIDRGKETTIIFPIARAIRYYQFAAIHSTHSRRQPNHSRKNVVETATKHTRFLAIFLLQCTGLCSHLTFIYLTPLPSHLFRLSLPALLDSLVIPEATVKLGAHDIDEHYSCFMGSMLLRPRLIRRRFPGYNGSRLLFLSFGKVYSTFVALRYVLCRTALLRASILSPFRLPVVRFTTCSARPHSKFLSR